MGSERWVKGKIVEFNSSIRQKQKCKHRASLPIMPRREGERDGGGWERKGGREKENTGEFLEKNIKLLGGGGSILRSL